MLKFGVVTHNDPNTCRVRVKFAAQEDVVSHWLPVLQQKTFQDKFYSLPDVDEQVACLMDERLEAGVVLGAIYSEVDNVSVTTKDKLYVQFSDGSVIEYDKVNHKMTADIKGAAEIRASEGVVIVGNVAVTGNITATGTITSNQP